MNKFKKYLEMSRIDYLDTYSILDKLLKDYTPSEILLVLSRLVKSRGMDKEADILHKTSTTIDM